MKRSRESLTLLLTYDEGLCADQGAVRQTKGAGAGARWSTALMTSLTGSSSSLADCSTATWPRGPHRVGSDAAENRTSVGAPAAAIRCIGPVSFPTAIVARAASAAIW